MNISVIIPVYNAEKYVRKAVKSALQFEEVKEVILIEDGSPDNALEVCKQLLQEDSRIKLFRHPNGENRGAGETRNLGLKNATCKYIAFLDADDYYLPNRFDKDKQVFANIPEAEGVYNAMGVYYVNKDHEDFNKLTAPKQAVEPENLFLQLMGVTDVKGSFSIVGLTVKRNCFDKTGLFKPDLRLHQDTDIILKLALTSKIYSGNIFSATCMRGVHNENRITNNKNKVLNSLKLNQSLYDWMVENNVNDSYIRIIKTLIQIDIAHIKGSLKNILIVLVLICQNRLILNNINFYKSFVSLFVRDNSFIYRILLKLAWQYKHKKYYS